MSMLTKILLVISIISIALFLLLSIIAIYNKILEKHSIKEKHSNKWFSKETLKLIILLLLVTSVFSSCSFVNSALADVFQETILIENSPNERITLEIQSGLFDGLGQGIIIYVKNNDMKNSKLEKLAQFNIHQDMASIGRGNIDLIWDNDIAKLMINGEAENLYINIWIDNESNEFKYESNYYKTNTF